MKLIEGGVCAAKGFTANGIHCGIRKNRTKNDLALIFSEGSMNNLQTVSIIAAFPIGLVIILIIASFIRDAEDYLEEIGKK